MSIETRHGGISLWHILKVLIAAVFAGVAGWIALFSLSMIRIWQTVEQFAAAGSDEDANRLAVIFEDAIRLMDGGGAIFLAASISCVVLSEVFRARSLIFYMAAAGALGVAAATALSSPSISGVTGQSAAALPIAGFIAGAVYWLIAGRSA
jgi:hypothetical protein